MYFFLMYLAKVPCHKQLTNLSKQRMKITISQKVSLGGFLF